MSPDAVVKVGGSLLTAGHPDRLLDALARLADRGHRLVVVPGGGPFADAVRAACATHRPGDSAAHWMAILAMDQHAELLSGLLPTARLVRGEREVSAALAAGRLAILAPHAWLRAADPLAHSWEVTSDSIAAWVAARLGAGRLILLKALDGLGDGRGRARAVVERSQLSGAREVDARFAETLPPSLPCWVISGRHPERLRELLEVGETLGTRVR